MGDMSKCAGSGIRCGIKSLGSALAEEFGSAVFPPVPREADSSNSTTTQQAQHSVELLEARIVKYQSTAAFFCLEGDAQPEDRRELPFEGHGICVPWALLRA